MPDLTVLRRFIEHLPLCVAMGVFVENEDDPVFVLPYSEKIVGNPNSGVLHGGAISTLLDSACGAMAISHPENNMNTATIDLRVDYMRPAKAKAPVYASAEVYHTTRHVAFLRGLAWDEVRDHPIAIATGTFSFNKKAR